MRCAILGGKARERQIVQVDEAVQQIARGIDFDGEPPFGEVDLNLVAPCCQTARISVSCSSKQVVDELVARIPRDAVRRIHQAQRRRRDDGLLDRHAGVTKGVLEVAVGIAPVAERTAVSRGIRRV